MVRSTGRWHERLAGAGASGAGPITAGVPPGSTLGK